MADELEQLCIRAAEERPYLTFNHHDFALYLSERVDVSQRVFVGDLLLAYCCVHKDPDAIHTFEVEILRKLKGRELGARTDDVLQETRLVLLVSEGAKACKMASYRGQSPLFVWVRTVARRIALRAEKSMVNPSPYSEEHPLENGPDVVVSEEQERKVFRNLFEAAADQLPTFERTALYMRYFEGANLETIAAALGKSRATTARRISQALLSLRTAAAYVHNPSDLVENLSVRRILIKKSPQ